MSLDSTVVDAVNRYTREVNAIVEKVYADVSAPNPLYLSLFQTVDMRIAIGDKTLPNRLHHHSNEG